MKTDLRVRRTRRVLQEALNTLMAEKALREITVQDITERAEVNRTTFYAHFEDKYDLLNYSVREWFSAELHRRMPDWTTFSPEHLQLGITMICEFLAGHASCAVPSGTLGEEQRFALTAMQSQLNALLLHWKQQDVGQLDAEDETRAHLISWAIFGTALQEAPSYRRTNSDMAALSAKLYRLLLPMIEAYLHVPESIP